MKKTVFHILLALGAILMPNACMPSDTEDEKVTLELSDDGIFKFPSTASEKKITVTTNQAEWTSITSNSDWLKTTQAGNTLTISVTENTKTVQRDAEIVVLAAGVGKKFYVEQAAANVSISASPDLFNITSDATTLVFEVVSNDDQWKVYTDSESWLTTTAKKNRSEVLVNVAKNNSRDPRVGKIYLECGDIIREIAVEQEGLLYFILPYMNFETGLEEIEAFELQRRSTLKNKNSERADFLSVSEAFEQITYVFTNMQYTVGVAFARNPKILTSEKNDFIDFLFKEGFEETDKTDVFFNREHSVEATINASAQNPQVVYEFKPQQPQDYQTWETLPFGFYDFEATKQDILDWEAAHGGVFDKNASISNDKFEFLAFNVTDDLGLIQRAYYVDNGGYSGKHTLIEASHIYTNMNLVFWKHKSLMDFTREFVRLYENSGFTFLGKRQEGFYTFEHNVNPIQMNIGWQFYDDFGKDVLDVRFAALDQEDGAKKDGIRQYFKDSRAEQKNPKHSPMTYKVPLGR